MIAALTPSRRKMFSKVRVTEVVPAPDEPVMAMMGCLFGHGGLLGRDVVRRVVAEQAALGEQRRVVRVVARLGSRW